MERDSPCDDFLLLQRSLEIIDHDEGDCLINHPALNRGGDFGSSRGLANPDK
jgi:hypothetical protein